LDEGFWPGYFEDSDFCLRVREAGFEVCYRPEAILTHEETASLVGTPTLSLAFHRGRLRFLLKHLSPQRFLTEFVSAEESCHLRTAQRQVAHALRMAYLEAIPAAASLLPRRWQTDAETIDKVLLALRQLYLFPVLEPVSFDPFLCEFDFPPTLPVLGPLVARLRSIWYSVAARWAVRYLAQQQELVNRQQKAINEQQEAMNRLYVHSLVSLSREVAHMILQLGFEREAKSAQDVQQERT
jgi:hypothetical protein